MFFTKLNVSLAFTLSLLSTAPPTWSAAATATRHPILDQSPNQSIFGDSSADQYQKYFAEALCTPYQKAVEEQAWHDALQYAQALERWQPNSSFQPAMDLYMGNDSRGQLSTTLRANIDGAVRVHDLSTWPKTQKVFVFCNEPPLFAEKLGVCGAPESHVIAYVQTINGTYYDNHYVVFCPRYYGLPSLYETLQTTDSLPLERLELSEGEGLFRNQAEVYFHESLHFADLTTPVGQPIHDSYGNESFKTYGRYNVSREAGLKNTAACLHIADAYAMAAAAIFAQHRYNLADPLKPMPSLPRRDISSHPTHLIHQLAHLRSPQLPDPDTLNNYIVSNSFGINPLVSVKQDSRQRSSGNQLTLRSSTLLKRMAWPHRSPCVSENGCTGSMAVTIATTISGPLICFLIAMLCVLSFIL